jgi:hypothetical protein
VGASLLCVLGIILCFFVLPVLQSPSAAWGNPAIVTFQALNVLLIIRFAHLWYRASGTPWAGVYGWFVFSTGFATVADSLNSLMAANRFSVDYGTPLDAIWWLPMIGIIFGRRLRSTKYGLSSRTEPGTTEEPRTDSIELLYLYAVAFPVMHFTLSALGVRQGDNPSPKS